jgi:hypothetical protein
MRQARVANPYYQSSESLDLTKAGEFISSGLE